MSCNGCRALRKGCGEKCALRSCLYWIESPAAQANATLFLAKFFGRSDLLSFVSAVPESQRSALFRSLLYEACGRTVNPVNGAVGLLLSGNWRVCDAAVETVLSGGIPGPAGGSGVSGSTDRSQSEIATSDLLGMGIGPRGRLAGRTGRRGLSTTADRRIGYKERTASPSSEEEEGISSSGMTSFGSRGEDDHVKLLNLFP